MRRSLFTSLVSLLAPLLPTLAFANFYEDFPYAANATLPGLGQTPPPWTAPFTWQTNNTGGVALGRITVNSASLGVNIFSDALRTTNDDQAYISPLAESPTNSLMSLSFDIRSPGVTTIPSTWWSLNVYTNSNFKLLSWDGFTNGGGVNIIRLTTPHGTFYDNVIANNSQIHFRTDLDMTHETLKYTVAGVRPAVFFGPGSNTVSSFSLNGAFDDMYYDLPLGTVGTQLDKIEIISKGFNRGTGGPDSQDLPNETVYLNNLDIEPTSGLPPIAQRSTTSGSNIVFAGGPYSILPGPGSFVSLSASNFLNDATFTAHYLWDLNNDGTFETDALSSPTIQLDSTYLLSLGLTPGTHTVALQATDNFGFTDTMYTQLEVLPEPSTLAILTLAVIPLFARRR